MGQDSGIKISAVDKAAYGIVDRSSPTPEQRAMIDKIRENMVSAIPIRSAIKEAAIAAGVTYIDDSGNARDVNFEIIDPAIFCLNDDEKRSLIAERLPFVLGESIRKDVPSIRYGVYTDNCIEGQMEQLSETKLMPHQQEILDKLTDEAKKFAAARGYSDVTESPLAMLPVKFAAVRREVPAGIRGVDGISVTDSTMADFDAALVKPLTLPAREVTYDGSPIGRAMTVQEMIDAGLIASAPGGRASEQRHGEGVWIQSFGRAARKPQTFDRFVERLSIMVKLCKAVSRGTVDADPKTCTITVRVPLIRMAAARRALPSVGSSSGYTVLVKPLSLRQHFTLWKFHSPKEGPL